MYAILNPVIYSVLVALFPYVVFRFLTEKKHRIGFWQRLGFTPGRIVQHRTGKPILWIHSVSVGEVLAAAPLVAEIRRHFPKYQLLLSTTTVTGQGVCIRRVASKDDLVIYFPLDVPFAVRQVMDRFSPHLILLMETEIWPNLIREASRRGIKLLLVNGRLSEKSFRNYRAFRRFLRRLLNSFAFIGMQTEEGRRRMLELGAPRQVVSVMGSMKYEAALSFLPPREDVQNMQKSLGVPDGKVIVAGSTHRGEEQLILRAYVDLKHKHPDLFLVVAPRHPERFQEVENLICQKGIPYRLRSRGGGDGVAGVMLLDTLGELMSLYGLGRVAFVGKSLTRRGGHNPLEPAAWGTPVVFGCHMDNFREVADCLVREGGAIEVSSFQELVSAFDRLLSDEAKAEEVGRRARDAVRLRTGGVARVVSELEGVLRKGSPGEARH
jgi:3-deoxy-D-manno-octulosonic-acid transferase